MSFPLPDDEAQRLEALHRYDAFDAPPEESINRTPRTLELEQQQALADLAAVVIDELELRRETAERRQTEEALRASEERFRFESFRQSRPG